MTEIKKRTHDDNEFSPASLNYKVLFKDKMTEVEFDQMMDTGLAQAKADDSFEIDEVFNELCSK